ncbi:unnamed protein product [Trichogramma brassicae]|uniref:MULE transposase domain-containing protein n=1 Tax=Trichogramma brassicae TaxID=86971 RepID=A0A6H5IRG9_9HYME|nr:unnamed protein product [Trichogramma brassicae]
MSYFELAIINAASAGIEGTVSLCLFHLCQSVYRRISRGGLKTAYRDQEPVRRAARMMCALAFVPTEKVEETFDQFAEQDLPEIFLEIVDYFEMTYIRGRKARGRRARVEVRYAPRLWNQYQSVLDGTARTNNASEGWHNRFQMTLIMERLQSQRKSELLLHQPRTRVPRVQKLTCHKSPTVAPSHIIVDSGPSSTGASRINGKYAQVGVDIVLTCTFSNPRCPSPKFDGHYFFQVSESLKLRQSPPGGAAPTPTSHVCPPALKYRPLRASVIRLRSFSDRSLDLPAATSQQGQLRFVKAVEVKKLTVPPVNLRLADHGTSSDLDFSGHFVRQATDLEL